VRKLIATTDPLAQNCVMSTDPRLARLVDLYERIHAHAALRDHGDTPLTMRRPVLQSVDSRLFLLAQGLAQSTQRVTGYPYRSLGAV
jgi:hypothetical protein